jgi:hypothetical protein
MKTFVRRLAVLIGAAAVSVGLVGVAAVPAHADDASAITFMRDSQWGG